MVKPVSFREKKDKDLIEHIKDKDFSYYVKELIREDMKRSKLEQPKPVEKNNKRNTDFGL